MVTVTGKLVDKLVYVVASEDENRDCETGRSDNGILIAGALFFLIVSNSAHCLGLVHLQKKSLREQ